MFAEAARNRITFGIIKFRKLRNHAVREKRRDKESLCVHRIL